MIGTNVEIYDSNFYGIRIGDRNISKVEDAKFVIIEDDIFIGKNVRALKGATIGRKSVIGNSANIVNDIPTKVIECSITAKVLKII